MFNSLSCTYFESVSLIQRTPGGLFIFMRISVVGCRYCWVFSASHHGCRTHAKVTPTDVNYELLMLLDDIGSDT